MSTAFYLTASANLFSSVCAFVIGFVFWRRSSHPLKLLTLLLAYTLLIFVAQALARVVQQNSNFTLHAYTAGAYTLIVLMFASWHKAPLSKLLRWSILVYFVIHGFLLLIGVEQLVTANKYSEQVAAFMIAAISLYTIFRLAHYHSDILIHKQPLFWVSMGIFLLFPGTIFVTAAITAHITVNLLLTYNIMAILSYCLISVGFLCQISKN